MTVGLNHSWKSTFAKALAKTNSTIVVLEGDTRNIFAKQEFGELYESTKKNQTFDHPNMKVGYLQRISKFVMENERVPLLAISNTNKTMRQEWVKHFHSNWRRVLGVRFDVSQEVLAKRMETIIRTESKSAELYSKGIRENLARQMTKFENPNASEFDLLIQLNENSNTDEMINHVQSLLQNNV